jgi:hypothetical protein
MGGIKRKLSRSPEEVSDPAMENQSQRNLVKEKDF